MTIKIQENNNQGDLNILLNRLIRDGHIDNEIHKDLNYIEDNILKPDVMNFVEQLILKPVDKKRSIIRNGYDRIKDLSYFIGRFDEVNKTNIYDDFVEYLEDLISDIPDSRVPSRGHNYTMDKLPSAIDVSKMPEIAGFTLTTPQGRMTLSNDDFLSMLSFDSYTDKYVEAIKSGDTSLKGDTRTRIGKLYTFFKSLHIRCTTAREAEAYLKKPLEFKRDGNSLSGIDFKDVNELEIGKLDHRNSLVRMNYLLYDSRGQRLGGIYEGLFLYYKLVKTYQFIDQTDVNTFFQFRGNVPTTVIDSGKAYEVFYSSNEPKLDKSQLRIYFIDFKIGNKKEARKGSAIPVCNAYDEFVLVFDSFYKDREMIKVMNNGN